jgi:hypothetical protein
MFDRAGLDRASPVLAKPPYCNNVVLGGATPGHDEE